MRFKSGFFVRRGIGASLEKRALRVNATEHSARCGAACEFWGQHQFAVAAHASNEARTMSRLYEFEFVRSFIRSNACATARATAPGA